MIGTPVRCEAPNGRPKCRPITADVIPGPYLDVILDAAVVHVVSTQVRNRQEEAAGKWMQAQGIGKIGALD